MSHIDDKLDEKRRVARATRRWNLLLALCLFVGSFASVFSAQRQQGIVTDESTYMSYGSRYATWWQEAAGGKAGVKSPEGITAAFGGKRPTDGNREHPPLMKTLFGFSKVVFHDKLGWCSETSAYRLPTVFFNALLVVLVFAFVLSVWGRGAGILAALLVLFLPRAFFHAGHATFDSPIVFFWFASVVAYWRALRSRWGFLWLGLAAGLTLATKHNAILLPAIFLPHYLWLLWRRSGESEMDAPRGVRLMSALGDSRPQLWLGLVLMAPLILILLWPWLWFDTVKHLRDWMAFHFHHVHYNYEYLGRNWNAPPFPWHVPIVTTLLTVPTVTIVCGLVGMGRLAVGWWRKLEKSPEEMPGLLLFLSAGVAMGPFLLRTTPIFGAEKHWAPAIPSLCIFAALGLRWMAHLGVAGLLALKSELEGALVERALFGALGTLVVLAAMVETLHAQPYGLTHYNALAGGAPGGADLGMNRQFWGYAARGTLEYLNRYAPEQGEKPRPVYAHDAAAGWGRYVKAGLLDRGLPNAGRETQGIRKSKLAIVVHEKHFNRHDYLIWDAYKSVQPRWVLTVDGVPIVSVYLRSELVDPRP